MLIAGAGGHALEVWDVLRSSGADVRLVVYDQNKDILLFRQDTAVMHTDAEVQEIFLSDFRFVLGVGKPRVRHRLYEQMTRLGGKLVALRGQGNVISSYAECTEADIFNHCFIGPESHIGRGGLINTGAQIHHEVVVGEFSEVNPGAVVLGAVQIGSFSSIGANATILPGIKVGDRAIIGAGAVVTRDVPDGATVVGVPARGMR